MTMAVLGWATWSGLPCKACLPISGPAGSIPSSVYKSTGSRGSLADFARLVEIFDAQGASFVSVTQQFIRRARWGASHSCAAVLCPVRARVTGERIRDKIAASKKKGMWMGGNVPLGYDASERTLVLTLPRRDRAPYLQSVPGAWLRAPGQGGGRRLGLRQNAARLRMARSAAANPSRAGISMACLQTRSTPGRSRKRVVLYPGLHPALIDDETWTAVRNQLAANTSDHRHRAKAAEPSLLAGLLVDAGGAVHPIPRHQERPTVSLLRLRRADHRGRTDRAQGRRIGAREIEEAVVRILIECRRVRPSSWPKRKRHYARAPWT